MTWVKIDDGMPDHRKWASLEANPREWAECMAVWVAVACYAARTLSDGYAETSRIERLTPLGKLAIKRCEAMVEASLMVKEGSGYRIHDWSKYNPTRDKVLSEREAENRRKQEKRNPKKSAAYDECPPRTDERTSAGTSERTEERTPDGIPERIPRTPRARNSRPDPTPPQDPLRGSGARALADVEAERPSEETRLRQGYQRRYQAEVGDAWMTHANDDQHVKRAASWARTQADPAAACERFLDGAFADIPRRDGSVDPWRRERRPWKWLAEDPGRTAARLEHAAVAAKATSAAHGFAKRPELEQREAVAYERALHRLKGEWAPVEKPWEADALKAAIAKGWDPVADLRAEGWAPAGAPGGSDLAPTAPGASEGNVGAATAVTGNVRSEVRA